MSAARRANTEAPYSQSDAIATVSRGKPQPCCAWLPAPLGDLLTESSNLTGFGGDEFQKNKKFHSGNARNRNGL